MTDTAETFSGRRLEEWKIAKKSGWSIETDKGWGVGLPEEVMPRVEVGQTYAMEFRGTQITGILIDGDWAFHRSDQDLEQERLDFVAKMHREHEEMLEQNRAEWAEREQALPEPLRARLANFRAHGGEKFDRDGWGYELIVCELAALYLASDGEDTEDIDRYAGVEGTSGNQHDFAKALARLLAEEPEKVGQTVSAMSPITGDPFWEGKE